MEKVKVVIRCIAYNHEQYIAQALDGFVMQQTNFKFVVVVHDDASTDRTPEILKEYAVRFPNIIKPILESENLYSKHDGSLRKIMHEACLQYGPVYIALCEGDDYWTDPYKLQKQVDFLDNHLNCHFVFTEAMVLKNNYIEQRVYSKNKYNTEDILGGVVPGLQTVMFRYEKFDIKLLEKYGKYVNGDILYAYLFSLQGDLECIHEKTAVYRFSGKGVHSSLNAKEKFMVAVSQYYRFHECIGFPNNRILYKLQTRFLFDYCWTDMIVLKLRKYFWGIRYINSLCKYDVTLIILMYSFYQFYNRLLQILRYKIGR